MSQEFSYISMVLATLQNKNQKVFQDIVYEYFAENNYIYFLDAFVSILSNICGFKWFKNLLEKYNNQTLKLRNFILDKTSKKL